MARLFVCAMLGLAVFVAVGYFGGPKWACFGFGMVSYLIIAHGTATRATLDRKL